MSHGTRDRSAHPDARSPFVFDIRPLGRQPGSSRAVHRSVPAPASFGASLVGVTEGADLELDILLEAVMEEDCRLDGDLLDLEQVCRDAVLLALPLSPLCSDDCPGLCAECGARLADLGQDHGHGDSVDPRWATLRQLDTADTVAGPGQDGRDHKDDRQEA